MRKLLLSAPLLAALSGAPLAYAKATPEEAAKLGKELTAVGAEAAGNKDGTIPEWVGKPAFSEKMIKMTRAELEKLRANLPKDLEKNLPKGTTFKDIVKQAREKLNSGDGAGAADVILKYQPSYVKDFITYKVYGKDATEFVKPLYVVTRDNLAQYSKYLTEGHKAMFRNYPTYKMVVYPTVRNAFFPDEIYAATIKNASTATLSGTDKVEGAELGFPFPIPKAGAEPLWNHKMKFRGSAVQRYNNQAIVKPDGTFKITKLVEDVLFVYGNLKDRSMWKGGSNMIAYYLSETKEPPRVAGQFTLVHEKIGPGVEARSAWIFSPGLGRVNRAPDVGFDNPAIGTDGEQFYDQVDVYNGALERYSWKLVGKKEVLIPYNSWILNSPTFKYADIMQPGHMTPDFCRYELHRVWVVEATLVPGQRHQLKKRVFYLDEDSWSIAAVDGYDNRDQLWKFQEAHLLTIPFIPTVSGIPEVIYDLQTKRYFLTTMTNEDPVSNFEIKYDEKVFSPAALQRRASKR
jgi:hypothetical protein